MITVASGVGNAHLLHINTAVIHHAPLRAVMHHGGRQYRGKMVSIVIICSARMIVLRSLILSRL